MSRQKRSLGPIDAEAHLSFILKLLLKEDYMKVTDDTVVSGRRRLRPIRLGIYLRKGAKQVELLFGSSPVQGITFLVEGDHVRVQVPIESSSGNCLAQHAGNFQNGTYNYRREGSNMLSTVPLCVVQAILEKMLGVSICFGPAIFKQITSAMLHRVESQHSKKRAMN